MAGAELGRIVSECRRFARKEVEHGLLAADDARDASWVAGLWKKSLSLDLPALLVPREHGGAGESDLCAALVAGSLARWCAGLASVFAFHFAALRALSALPENSPVKARLFSAAASSADPAMFTVILPDPSAPELYEIKTQNESPEISGRSPAAGNAALARFFLVFAKDEAGILNLLMVPRGAAGLSFGPDPLFPGLCANPLLPVAMERIPAVSSNAADAASTARAVLLAGGSKAEKILETARNAFFGFVAAVAVGLAEACFEHAFDYAKNRYQFGKMIVHHSELQRMLGRMLQGIKVGRAAYTRVFEEDSAVFPNAGLGVFAKTWCADAALSTASDCVQIFGGYGVMHEYGMEKRMRDAKMLQLLGGSTPWLLVESVKSQLA